MSAMNALMARFRVEEPLYNLPSVLGNALLVLQVFAMLHTAALTDPSFLLRCQVFTLVNSTALTSGPLGSDVLRLIDGDYVLRPEFLCGVHYGCLRIALFIIGGAYGFHPDVSGFDFPITLPLAALRQSRLPIPSILFLLSYPHNGWIGQRFPSRAAALLQGQAYCTFARTGMAWVIECLRRSVQTGITSEWKFGAMLGMPESEFLTRALESSPSQDLEMRYTRASDFWVYPALDFGIWIDSVASNR